MARIARIARKDRLRARMDRVRTLPKAAGRPWLLAATATALILTPTLLGWPGSPSLAQVVGPAVSPAGGGQGMGAMGDRSGDAHFIVMMIPHHEGAIAMADLALKRARHVEIRALAERIRTSQSQENAQMRRWYGQWFGGPVPAWPGPGRGWGMGPGMGMGMPGMGTSLLALREAPDFDRAFLEQMIAHHRMGVMMASHAQWSTVHPELRELQAAMVKVQSQEIAQMEQWYRQWYGSGSTT